MSDFSPGITSGLSAMQPAEAVLHRLFEETKNVFDITYAPEIDPQTQRRLLSNMGIQQDFFAFMAFCWIGHKVLGIEQRTIAEFLGLNSFRNIKQSISQQTIFIKSNPTGDHAINLKKIIVALGYDAPLFAYLDRPSPSYEWVADYPCPASSIYFGLGHIGATAAWTLQETLHLPGNPVIMTPDIFIERSDIVTEQQNLSQSATPPSTGEMLIPPSAFLIAALHQSRDIFIDPKHPNIFGLASSDQIQRFSQLTMAEPALDLLERMGDALQDGDPLPEHPDKAIMVLSYKEVEFLSAVSTLISMLCGRKVKFIKPTPIDQQWGFIHTSLQRTKQPKADQPGKKILLDFFCEWMRNLEKIIEPHAVAPVRDGRKKTTIPAERFLTQAFIAAYLNEARE